MITLLLATLLGCGTLAPESTDTLEYLKVLQPVLHENQLLTERVLTGAAAVYEAEDGAPDGLPDTVSGELAPLASHVHDRAAQIAPPATWTEAHKELVAIWKKRASAYRALSEAIETDDADGFAAARKDLDAVLRAEEEWVEAANARAESTGYKVDLYP